MVDQHFRISDIITRAARTFSRKVFHPWFYRIVRISLAGIFIYAGAAKLLDPKAFAAIISAYDLVPEALLPAVAIGLPLLEVVAGAALVLDRLWGLYTIAGLLAVFVFVLGYGIIFELDVDCGCFGAEELNRQASLKSAFYRDLFILGLVVPYLRLARRFHAPAKGGDGTL